MIKHNSELYSDIEKLLTKLEIYEEKNLIKQLSKQIMELVRNHNVTLNVDPALLKAQTILVDDVNKYMDDKTDFETTSDLGIEALEGVANLLTSIYDKLHIGNNASAKEKDFLQFLDDLDKEGMTFTFNSNRDFRKHNKPCYDSIHENTEQFFGIAPEKMVCTLENCVCKCHKKSMENIVIVSPIDLNIGKVVVIFNIPDSSNVDETDIRDEIMDEVNKFVRNNMVDLQGSKLKNPIQNVFDRYNITEYQYYYDVIQALWNYDE